MLNISAASGSDIDLKDREHAQIVESLNCHRLSTSLNQRFRFAAKDLFVSGPSRHLPFLATHFGVIDYFTLLKLPSVQLQSGTMSLRGETRPLTESHTQ
jgi:hypothetical protein